MAIDHSELLGPAELHIIKEFTEAAKGCAENAQKLADLFNEIEYDNLDAMMLDADGKDLVINTVDHLRGLENNLSMSTIMATVLNIAINKR